MKPNKISIAILAFVFLGIGACTNLEETLNDSANKPLADQIIDVSSLINAAYAGMRLPYQDQSRFWAAQQHTSDETLGPTRGPDWDDNGVWRVLHDHTWDADHAFLGDTYDDLLKVVFSSTNALSFLPTPEQAAEARFLRAFVMFSVADGWNQVPFRQPNENLLEPPKVLTGSDALDFVISECEEIIATLTDGPAYLANKDAAKVLLMKAYLNKGTFADRSNPTFPKGDMDKVIQYADEIMASGKYTLTDNYYDNFAPNNGAIGTGNIFTALNEGGTNSGNVRSRWYCTLHYNQNPSGWNGFATIADFYDKFETDDVRRSADYTGTTDISGIKVGFLEGQQQDQDGNDLEDRKGAPLAFTKEVKLTETGNNLEVTGVRVVKYPIDYNGGDNADNDYVYYRLADVMLMKAEALLRGGGNGSAGEAANLVNTIRAKRNVGDLASVNLDNLLDERGRELYWEGHRRQDLIRFGKFLDAWNEKPASGQERLIFAIPSVALSVNPNLVQNPGY